MNCIALIPARYASTRFPGKPLALLGGKPVIQWVYERVCKTFADVAVATDDQRIFDCVTGFGGKAVMTSPNHKSGTDRLFEAYCRLGEEYDVVVNVQGDEPFIQTEQLETVRDCFSDPSVDIATLAMPFTTEDGTDALFNPNSPKVIMNPQMEALYFSRSVIPYLRNTDTSRWLERHTYYKHIGLYAYRAHALRQITSLPQSPLELAESLEQLRWLENGYKIKVGLTTLRTIGIDTPDDLLRAEEYLKSMER